VKLRWRDDFRERDELRQDYQLAPGAQVEVSGINGQLQIETALTDVAEVAVIRYARNGAALQARRIVIEYSAESLRLRVERTGEQDGLRDVEVIERVTLRLPLQVKLDVSRISGPVSISDIGGALNISRVSGPVKIGRVGGPVCANGISGSLSIGDVEDRVEISKISGPIRLKQAVKHLSVSDVSGGISATIARMDKRGVSVEGISGPVALSFKDALDADLSAERIGGGLRLRVPDVTYEGEPKRTAVKARIGAGGSPILISRISGSVRLSRA
jgi:hypothetical protein